jgi:O-antigen/teichoic acid export membrane protein
MSLIANALSSSLLRATLVYGGMNALNRAVPFMLVPVFTRYLTPYDYGMVTMFGVALSIATTVSGLGVVETVSLRYFQRDTFDLGVYVANCMYVLAASCAVLALVLLAFPDALERVTDLPRGWNGLVIATAAATFISTTLLHLWQSSQQPLRYSLFRTLQTLVNVSLSVLLVVGLGHGWHGRMYAQVAVALVGALVALYYLRRAGWLTWRFDARSIRGALVLGVPLLPHLLAGFVIEVTDRLYITNLVNVEQAGIYAVGKQAGMVMLMLTSSFNMAWVPWLFEKLKTSDAGWKRKIVLATYAYDAGILALALALGGIAPWLFGVLVGEEFASGSQFVVWIALGYAFNGMYMMVTNYLVYAERTGLVSIATFCSAGVNVVATYWLIKLNGTVGAAQGAALSHLCSFVLTWLLAARVYPMPWLLRR